MAGSLGDLGGMLRQAQKMQRELAAKQEELGKRRFEGRAGGSAVIVTMNGARQLLELKIDPAVVNPEEADLLEDLVLTAVNDALRKVEETTAKELGELSGGMGLPGMM